MYLLGYLIRNMKHLVLGNFSLKYTHFNGFQTHGDFTISSNLFSILFMSGRKVISSLLCHLGSHTPPVTAFLFSYNIRTPSLGSIFLWDK